MQPKKSAVQHLVVDQEFSGQRIDNFLIRHLKSIPKTRVYRILRCGEVRVNKKRIAPSYRLQEKDDIRLPPLYLGKEAKHIPPSAETCVLLENRILYEDESLMIINKPPGMSVHGGSTVRVGVIDALRASFPQYPHLELVHRLDSDTSGCLMIAKKRSMLRELHALLREGKISKIYLALTKGQWKPEECRVDAPLQKYHLKSGRRLVKISAEGKSALTVFKPLHVFQSSSLVEVYLYTGRTHQIRVHAQYLGHPVAGDERYGDSGFNKLLRQRGLKRLFLHAQSLDFIVPSNGKHIHVEAALDEELDKVLYSLKALNGD